MRRILSWNPLVLIVGSSRSEPELAHHLRSAGFRTAQVNPATSSWNATSSLECDAALLDLDESPVSGWKFLDEFGRRREHAPIVVLSSSFDVQSAVRAMKLGASDVLEKPASNEDIETKVRACMERERGLASGSSRETLELDAPRTPAYGLAKLIGHSPTMQKVREQIQGIARFHQVTTLIVGETGTGKEVVAEALHEMSSPKKPFLTVNCAAIPENLFESELFGYEAGAFTGARTMKPGLLEAAADGTLLLDEVGELAPSLQPKLLRVLQSRTFRRVGGARDIELKARIMSATNRKLSSERQDGMRSDLYFRLAGFTIVLPPLRHRRSDIPLLANHFLLDFAEQYPGVPTRMTLDASELLTENQWHGNVRELKRVVEHAAMVEAGAVLGERAVATALEDRRADYDEPESGQFPIFRPASGAAFAETGPTELGLNELQQRMILEAFEANERNLTKAARALRIPRTTLRDRLKRYGTL